MSQKLGLPERDPQVQIVINEAILVHIFVNAFMLPSVCIDKDQDENLSALRNTDFFINSTNILSFVRKYLD